jgi:dTDP-4-amino-4,6-dideoxygalactose transaminase
MVKFFNLDRHWNSVRDSVQSLADESLSAGLCQKSPVIERVESRISNLTNKKHCVTFSNCSDALAQGLRNLKLPSNSEVLVPEYTFTATINAIRLAGLRPVFVDVDDFYHIDLEDAVSKISNNTQVLLYVTLLGSPSRSDVTEWCNKYKLILVEDAAQSFGTSVAASSFSVLSFSPSKPCTTFGSGGALVTDCIGIASNATCTRLHGNQDYIGINSMMSTTEASALQINLGLLDQHLARRREIANHYLRELTDKYQFPKYRKGCTYSKFIIQSTSRDDLKLHLDKNNIQTMIHYNKEFTQTNCKRLSKISLTLPNCSYMTDQEVERVIKCLKEF